MDSPQRYNIAIIGGGIAGLSAAAMLHKYHNIKVFEANSQVGGHSNTVTVTEQHQSLSIDTGFIVFNENRDFIIGIFSISNFVKLSEIIENF